MLHPLRAVIFDMDGVIIDSEHLWKRAELEIFSALGVPVSENHAKKTQALATREVTEFWYQLSPWNGVSLEEVEQRVVSRVMELIEAEGQPIPGIKPFMEQLRLRGFKIGLATNSPQRIIPQVLKKANIEMLIDEFSSAEFVEKGKPDPAVYLLAAKKLDVDPAQCLVIEDSHTGMRAAKSAGMHVIGFTNGNVHANVSLADEVLTDFSNLPSLIVSCTK